MKKPFVIVISDTPLLGEAIAWSLESRAHVQRFSPGRGEIRALLRWAAADGAVVDDDRVARRIETHARSANLPVLHIRDGEAVRILREHGWEDLEGVEDVLLSVGRALLDEIDTRMRKAEAVGGPAAVAPPFDGAGPAQVGSFPRGERR